MALKSKMFAFISAFVLTLGMLIIGVWASLHVQLELGGDLAFTATDVNVEISGNTTGAVENYTFDTIRFSANSSEDDSLNTEKLNTWKNNTLTFNQAGDDITITILIQNMDKSRSVNIIIQDTKPSTVGVNKEISYNYNSSVTVGSQFELPANEEVTFTITLSLANKNDSLASGVQYGYIIDLSDDSYVPLVSSNNEGLGTVDYTLNDDDSVTLIAKPNPNALFVGWKNNAKEFISVNTMGYFQDTIFDAIKKAGVSINDLYDNYFVDYYQIDDSNEAFQNFVNQVNSTPGMDSKMQEDFNFEVENIKNDYYRFNTEHKYGNYYTAVFASKQEVVDYTENSEYDYKIYQDVDLAVVTKYKGSSTEIIIPNTINGNNVIGIYQDLLSVKVPDGPSYSISVQWCAHNITKVTLPETFLEIGLYEYYQLPLQEINLPNSLLNIKGYSFYATKLNEISIPENVKVIDDGAFYANNDLKVTFDENSKLEIIKDEAFGECYGNNSITFPSNVEYIGKHLFTGAGSRFVALTFTGTNPPVLANNAFEYLSLSKIYVPNGCEELYKEEISWQSYKDMVYSVERKIENKDFAFHINDDNLTLEVIYLKNDNLTKIEIPSNVNGKNVTSIGDSAFSGCSSLENITIPSSVTSIGSYAFYDCSSLASVTFENKIGWQVSESSDFSSYTGIESTDLLNTATAITYLTKYSWDSPSGYANYYWRRVS